MSGQIAPSSEFGQKLTELAHEANTIVEIGTMFGNGSTLCLHNGMTRANQKLITIDKNNDALEIARQKYKDDSRVVIIHGTLVLPWEFQPFAGSEADKKFYHPEKTANASAPYVFESIPWGIDLLVLDGGDWTSDVEFTKLKDRFQIVAMDDTNIERSNKNWRARHWCLQNKWECVDEDLMDRNGWSIFRKPKYDSDQS